eukprot:68503_1
MSKYLLVIVYLVHLSAVQPYRLHTQLFLFDFDFISITSCIPHSRMSTTRRRRKKANAKAKPDEVIKADGTEIDTPSDAGSERIDSDPNEDDANVANANNNQQNDDNNEEKSPKNRFEVQIDVNNTSLEDSLVRPSQWHPSFSDYEHATAIKFVAAKTDLVRIRRGMEPEYKMEQFNSLACWPSTWQCHTHTHTHTFSLRVVK